MVALKESAVAFDPVPSIASELNLSAARVQAVAALLAEGATVPFIARYRKEVSGNMDEVQIGTIQERMAYHLELEARRQTILASIKNQGQLTPALEDKIRAAVSKTELEDLYLPFKPKRRTRAMLAREKGLEPLATMILRQGAGDIETEAVAFVSAEKGVADAREALAGARDIVAETISEMVEVRNRVRRDYATQGVVVSRRIEEKTQAPTKFEQYYEFSEKVGAIPSHRYLAIRRGENEGFLRRTIELPEEPEIEAIKALLNVNAHTSAGRQLALAVEDGYKRLLAPGVAVDTAVDLKMKSDAAAVEVFATNLRTLLLAAPLGARAVVGIDPGFRSGCKCAAVDATGRFLGYITIFPDRGAEARVMAQRDLYRFIREHNPAAIAIGNGTAGRETETFVRELLATAKISDLMVAPVSEAGASVYSASEVARAEFPDLDLTIRGAISIARRLQDPLAELVKIDPKSIGVGQYQHDVHQPMLQRKLDEVVVSCVNAVGVELNTASARLLARVAGVSERLAGNVVAYRNEKGAFTDRKQLLKVPGLGPKTFEQCAGFLRIHGATHALDASAVHPERYGLVERMAADLEVALKELVGHAALADRIDIRKYVGDDVGEPTLRDIIAELKKPGRDPRARFEPPKFREDVTQIEHLKPGMELEGVVTNVVAFGAFVDIGVHQDGLVHVSQLADRFIKDPSEVVRAGDRIKVKVLEVNKDLKRIALTCRKDGGAGAPSTGAGARAATSASAPRQGGSSRSASRDGFRVNPFGGL